MGVTDLPEEEAVTEILDMIASRLWTPEALAEIGAACFSAYKASYAKAAGGAATFFEKLAASTAYGEGADGAIEDAALQFAITKLIGY
jgi:hypothetical protein